MRTCWALLLSSVLVLPATAKAQETRGTISGTVRDAQGVVPGANVTFTSLDTGGAQHLVNLLNYAAFNNPITDPTNTNFGKVTTAVAAAGAMRFFNFVMRFTFSNGQRRLL